MSGILETSSAVCSSKQIPWYICSEGQAAFGRLRAEEWHVCSADEKEPDFVLGFESERQRHIFHKPASLSEIAYRVNRENKTGIRKQEVNLQNFIMRGAKYAWMVERCCIL
jgi:hypothetical protein